VTPYQIFLLVVLVTWPFAIMGLLFLMSRLESYVARLDAGTPEEAGLEPVAGSPPEKEVKIVFGGRVVGGPEPAAENGAPAESPAQVPSDTATKTNT
jgi:hypothetical protein